MGAHHRSRCERHRMPTLDRGGAAAQSQSATAMVPGGGAGGGRECQLPAPQLVVT